MSGNKLYSKKEISDLLKRATELQKKEKGNDEEGLTLQEIEDIASEAGINPSFIREALSEQHKGIIPEQNFHILGGPTSLEVGREIPYELSPDEWELVVQEARRTFNKSGGTVQKLGNSLEWMSPDHKFIQASLTATPSASKTRFFVSTHFGKIAFMSYYFSFVLLMLTMGIFVGNAGLSLIPSLSIMLAGAVTVFGGVRLLFGRWVRGQKKKLENMISRFEEVLKVNEPASAKPKDSVPEEKQSRISIPVEDRSESENELQNRYKTRSGL